MARTSGIFAAMSLVLLVCAVSCRSDSEAPQKELTLKRPTAESGDPVNLFAEFRMGLYAHNCCEEAKTGRGECVTITFVKDEIIVTGAPANSSFLEFTQTGAPGIGPIPTQVVCRITRGSFSVDSNLVFTGGQSGGAWDGKRDGAVHRLRGKLVFCGYEFDSDEGNPLTFQVTRDGYKYLYGDGTVKDTETGEVHELKDSSKMGALLRATASGNLDSVKTLIDGGTPVDARRPYGDTALIALCRKGIPQRISPIQSGTDFKGQVPEAGPRLMETAAFLLDKGADINSTDVLLDRTPLMTAIVEADDELALMLIGKGADVNIKDRYGEAPLTEAARKCNLKVIRACLDAKAVNPDIATPKDVTPLMTCAQDILSAEKRKECAESARLLLEKGASPNASDKQKVTPLMRASRNNFPELVTLLLDKGAAIDAADHDGATALMHACFLGRLPVVEILLARGANVNVKAKNGVTALQIANGKKWAKIVEILRAKGAR